MAAKQTIVTTTTVKRTRTKRTKTNGSGGKKKCPSCGKYY